ncbi:MAG: AraC family transcriptional regulator [Bacteroidales bacterium]|nr:AraC family transcriptional regulator [Bacteroidales bacterium]
MTDYQSTISISFDEIGRHIESNSSETDILSFRITTPLAKGIPSPFRINGLLLILCKEGIGHITIDLSEYTVKENTLIVIQPRNYVQFGDFSEDYSAICIACSPHIAEDFLPQITDIMPLLLQSQLTPTINLQRHDAHNLEAILNFLDAKLQGPPTPLRKKKLLCILQAALFEIMDTRLQYCEHSTLRKTRKEELMADFIIAVSQEFKSHREVSYYADKLCISTKHLSTTVKETSGRTPGEWIENYVVLEAKILLRSTNLTIQEITRELNFRSQSFFGKYFRNITGISPTKYRQQNR